MTEDLPLHPPLDGKIGKLPVNQTLHGRSIFRHRHVAGHCVVHGYYDPGTGDAVDLFVPAGVPVYAMHGGRVTRIAERGGVLACLYVEGKAGRHTALSVYAHLHIKDGIRVGTTVDRGEVIGWVGRKVKHPHLHLEAWIDGAPISDPKPRDFAKRIAELVK